MALWDHLKLVAGPATSLLNLDEVKAHLRVSFDDDDDYITSLIAVATAFIDGPWGAGVPLLTQTWRLSLDCFPEFAALPLSPVQSVTSFTYTDVALTTRVLDPRLYVVDLDSNPARVVRAWGQWWPMTTLTTAGAVKITFLCGFGDFASDVPADIRHAAILLIGHWYENREAVVGIGTRDTPAEMPFAVTTILNKYRAISFA
jgi:uncharacterized phiE125 gp8 family phage protein